MAPKQMMQKAIRHLRESDPVLSSIICDDDQYTIYRRRSYFESLVRIIIGQQLSSYAARTIFDRVKSITGKRYVTIQNLSRLDDKSLLTAGVSRAKLDTIRSLITAMESGNINLRSIAFKDDENVTRELTQIKGIGPWSVQMYLMFVLRRPDIFPSSDAGISNAIRKLYNNQNGHVDIDRITDRWKPYRTVACWYLWRYIDTEKKNL